MSKKKQQEPEPEVEPHWRDKWEVEQRLKLKAQHEMVNVVKRGVYGNTAYQEYAHGRLPRRIGEIHCDTGIDQKHGYGNRVSFPLHLDAHKGLFIAEHGDTLYVSASKEALHAKMEEVAKVKLDLKWTRWIEVEYKAYLDDDYSRSVDLDDKRTKKMRVTGLQLKWKVVEYSDAFTLPSGTNEKPERLYMTRAVEDGVVSDSESTVTDLPEVGMVAYTPEREALLQQVQDALKQIDGKLYELLRGKSEDVAARLDRMTLPQLMSGGEA